MQDLTRRTVLRLGAGLAGACAFDPILQLGLATASGAPPERPTPSSATATTMLTGSFVSAARGGVETNWAIALPPGRYSRPLRPVIALHGRDMTAEGVMGMGVEAGLADLAMAGYPPFAVVAVDGHHGERRITGHCQVGKAGLDAHPHHAFGGHVAAVQRDDGPQRAAVAAGGKRYRPIGFDAAAGRRHERSRQHRRRRGR